METPLFNLDHRHGWTPASYLHRFLTLACALKGSSWGNLGEATTPSKILSPHAPEEKVFGSTPRSTMTGARLQPLAARTPHALASPLTLVGAGGSPTERRTEWPVGQQPNKRSSVGPLVRATDAEQNVVLFGAAVSLSRDGSVHVSGGSVHVPGSCAGQGSLLSVKLLVEGIWR